MHQIRLAAGLCPDPLGELKRSPDPLAAIDDSYLTITCLGLKVKVYTKFLFIFFPYLLFLSRSLD